MTDVLSRFLDKVEIGDGCWSWVGATAGSRQARGQFWFNGRKHNAARFIYHHQNPTADMSGKVVMHRCDNPLCVNPDHLLLGTQAENVADMMAKGRSHHQVDPSVNSRSIRKANATMAADPSRRPTGERHGRAAVTDAERLAIGASAEATSALAARFGVHRTTIQRIRAAALRSRSGGEDND